MACFRVMSELRDAPRVAAILRSDPPPLPDSERFWQDLEARTTAAAAAALAGTGPAGDAEVARPRLAGRRWFGRGAVAGLATAAAAAALVLLVPRARERQPGVVMSGAAAAITPPARTLSDDETAGTLDVGDLDGAALRRLADRLRARTPVSLTALVGGGGTAAETGDVLADDDEAVDDELADLDVSALRRVESSLAGASR